MIKIIKRLLSSHNQMRHAMIHNYLHAIDTGSAPEFIKKHARVIKNMFGRQLLCEFILNYRVVHTPKHPAIFDNFVCYIMSKDVTHTSDLAIAHNILSYVRLTDEQQAYIVGWAADRIADISPTWGSALNMLRDTDSVKRQLVISLTKGMLRENKILHRQSKYDLW